MNSNEDNKPTILVTGAFDPLHLGHLLVLKHASSYGELIVGLNSDEWLQKKRGFSLIDFKTRKVTLELDVPFISQVIEFDDSDGTCCDAIRKVKPTFFGNGGSATAASIPKKELELCKELNIEPIFNLGDTSGDFEERYISLAHDTILRHTLKEVEKMYKLRDFYKEK
jgi:D-beta-D-heptose 7-phosphate kinase/D-beta-D-heptose 1-phosphate adenosyltransferase